VAWLSQWLVLALAASHHAVRVHAPLTLEGSEPEPDLAVVPVDVPRPYHPSTATLVIEVAVSSLRQDLHTKPRLYARAGIEHYWVLDLDGRRAVAHSGPGPDGYREVTTVPAEGQLVATAIPLPPLPLAEVLAAAAA